MAAVHQETTICIKEEATEEVPVEQGSTFLEDPVGVSWCSIDEKPELNLGWCENENNNSPNGLLDAILEAESECCPPPLLVSTNEVDGVKCEMEKKPVTAVLVPFILAPKEEPVLEDPLNIKEPGLHIKQDAELKYRVGGSEHNFVAYPLATSWSTDFIKQDPELILEDIGTEINVGKSRRYGSDSSRLSQNSSENCGILYEEAVTQTMVPGELKIDSEQSTRFTLFDTHTPGLDEQEEEEESLCVTRLKCNLREKQFNKFTCSFCLQNFPSKYRLIMHVFIHIDGVQPPIYVCKSCGEVFASDISLIKHLKISESDKVLHPGNNKKFDCSDDSKIVFFDGDLQDVCEKHSSSEEIWKISNKSFVDIHNTPTMTQGVEKLDRHSRYATLSTTGNVTDHTVELIGKRIHKCDSCGKSFSHLGHFKTHALTHNGDRSHKCDVCGKSFTRLDILKKHSLTHTGQRPHKCDICGKSFTLLGDLKRHSLTHTGRRPHKCDICGKSFIRLTSLKRHALTKTGQRAHKCDICGKSFTLLGDLKKHALTHTGPKPHKCDICGKSFTLLGGLKRHSLTHTGQRPHKCDICGKTFTQNSTLKTHSLTHTGQRSHKCDICGKSFTLLCNLKCHALTHTGQRPHKCDICGKSFTQISNLKTHSLTHTGQRPHKCDICGKSFAQISSLKTHLLTHTGQRPHKCDICGKSFTRISNLKTHLLTHTGQRSHKCDICGKSFTRLDNLKCHALTHTGERSHKCDICGKSFTRNSTLKTHSLTHWPETPQM